MISRLFSLVLGSIVVAVGSLFVWLAWEARRRRHRLANRPCPRCGVTIGLKAARRAINTRFDGAEQDVNPIEFGEIDPGERRVICPACRGESVFYLHTEQLSPTRNFRLGIPESSRALPKDS